MKRIDNPSSIQADFIRMVPPISRFYEGLGEHIRDNFVQPTLARAVRYDRLTSYFSIESIVRIADQIEEIWRRGGMIRLVIGIHQVPIDLVEAADQARWAAVVIDRITDDMIAQITTLRDEMSRNRLQTLAWMIQSSLLRVNIAAPRTRDAQGIFHSKRYIFVDADGNSISAVGSPNETGAGLGANFEELTVHMSWESGGRDYVEAHVASFNRIWENKRPDLIVKELNGSFAERVLKALDVTTPIMTRSQRGGHSMIRGVIDAIAKMPYYMPHNLGSSALFPHQERAFIDAMSRWPVRVLLADEVGLGKTLEAGAVMAALLRHRLARRCVVLAPKNVMRQWQEEMWLHFAIDFQVYDSGKREFVDHEGRITRQIGVSYDESWPERVIVSAQLSRGTRTRPHIFEKSNLYPDLLVVDEAHAARMHVDLDGSKRPTLFHKMLEEISPRIGHLLLLTATPVQVNPTEFHSLLSIVGLAGLWAEESEYLRSLNLLARAGRDPGPNDGKQAINFLRASYRGYAWKPEREFAQTSSLVTSPQAKITHQDAFAAQKNWDIIFPLLVEAHPGNLLAIRNTRSALQRHGYRFPERIFEAPSLSANGDVDNFYDRVERYLEIAYAETEKAARPDETIGVGFARSSYFQRLASSLYAAERSLTRRLAKIRRIAAHGEVEEVTDELDDEVDTLATDEPHARPGASLGLARAYSIESSHIEDLLDMLSAVNASYAAPDPKIEQLVEIIRTHQAIDSILVFSRYTDTVDEAIRAFEDAFDPETRPGYAMYTGSLAWICVAGIREKATKQDVRLALEAGRVRVVFCSDAASEGLNLQAARILINIDVPWNPARLEQRIGRVARLGQIADSVLIYNLWYPKSVEAKMYGRLLSRKDYYELAVGESPEIFSEAIRQEVESRISGGGGASPFEDYSRLQEERSRVQNEALAQVWDLHKERLPGTAAIYAEMLEYLSTAALAQGWRVENVNSAHLFRFDDGTHSRSISAEPGRADSLTLTNPIISTLALNARARARTRWLEILADDVPIALAHAVGDCIHLIGADQIPQVVRALVSGIEIDESRRGPIVGSVNAGLDADIVERLSCHSRWWCFTARVTIPCQTDAGGSMETRLRNANWTFSNIGRAG